MKHCKPEEMGPGLAPLLTVGKVNEKLDELAAATAGNQPGEKATAAKQATVLR